MPLDVISYSYNLFLDILELRITRTVDDNTLSRQNDTALDLYFTNTRPDCFGRCKHKYKLCLGSSIM
jgi:hypothetical protein